MASSCSACAAVKAETPVGLEAKAVMERGELVSDEIVSKLIDAELTAMGPDVGAIFDGYPRTAARSMSPVDSWRIP